MKKIKAQAVRENFSFLDQKSVPTFSSFTPHLSSSLLPPSQVESIVSLNVSDDKKYISVCVRRFIERSKATILIYDMEAERSYPKAPKLLQYEDSSTMDLFFLRTKFSTDSKYLAAYTPRPYLGVLIFDWKINKLVATIPIKSLTTAVSFNPLNNTRLCVTGACGLFQFWHFTTKSTYSAPINGLTRTDVSFNCHEWVGSDTVIGGTDKGQLYLIVGCEMKQFLHIFGASNTSGAPNAVGTSTENTYIHSSITEILVKDSLILAYSPDGYVALIRLLKGEGRNGTIQMKLECYFLLKDMDLIYGLVWCEKRFDSMSIAVSGVDRVAVYQLPILAEPSSQNAANGTNLSGNLLIFTPHLLKKNEIVGAGGGGGGDLFTEEDDDGMETDSPLSSAPPSTRWGQTPPHSSRQSISATNNKQHNSTVPSLGPRLASSSDLRHKYIRHHSSSDVAGTFSNAIKRVRSRWPYLTPVRLIASHHSGMITTLASNPRSSLLLTSSPKDMTIKVWDYNRVGGDALLVSEDYTQRQNEYPNTIDMHPLGFFFVVGTSEHVIEYAITDSKYELLRKIPIKTAVLSPTGEPIMNSSPVSIVKYSSGGHLIAVATGRLIQIFEVYNLNYQTPTSTENKTGTPERMMIFTDHIATVTDLTFTRDDLKLFSCALDGTVYEWNIDRTSTGRVNDYVMRGVPATHVCTSPSGKYIFATFESDAGGPGGAGGRGYNKSLNRSMSRQNSEWLDENTNAVVNQQATERGKSGILLMRADSMGGGGAGSGGAGQTGTPGLLGRTTSNSSDQQTPGADRGKPNRSHLVMWKNGSLAPNTEEILDLLVPITSLAFGRLDGREGHEIVVLGLLTGEVVISLLPLPLKILNQSPKKFPPSHGGGGASVPTNDSTLGSMTKKTTALKRYPSTPYDPDEVDSDAEDSSLPHLGGGLSLTGNGNSTTMSYQAAPGDENTNASTGSPTSLYHAVGNLSITGSGGGGGSEKPSLTYDETLCRVLTLHEGSVTKVLVSSSGLWIWSCGVDGCLFMLNTNLKAKDQTDVLEALSNENHITLTDKHMLLTQQNRLDDKETLLEELAKEKKHSLHQVEVQREKEKKLLEETMAREISKRDDIIVQGRHELQSQQKKMTDTINTLHHDYQQQLSELEVVYEKKLAHETVYIQNMRQAYDEYVTHIKYDLEGYQKKAQIKEEKLLHEKEEIIEETEKQKKLLLEYTDYVGERHREVLKVLTESHDEQK
jgi:WD40 repeat protein